MTEEPAEKQRLKRRSRPETRELMLVAGALLAEAYALGEAPYRLQTALSHIRFDEVLELATKLQLHLEAQNQPLSEAGFDLLAFSREHMLAVGTVEIGNVRAISRGSAYFAFDDEGDYRTKLADYLLGVERWPDVGVWRGAFAESQERHDGNLPPFDEALLAMARAVFEDWVIHPEPLVEMALAQFALDPEVANRFEETATRRRRGTHDEPGLNDWFVELLDRYGRVLRPGIDIDQLSTTVMCLTYGFLFGSRSAPLAVSEPVDWRGADTSLYSVALEAIVSHVTSLADQAPPVEGGEPSDQRTGSNDS